MSAALDMIRAQQALAKARAEQERQLKEARAAERAKQFEPVAQFVRDLAAEGAVYEYANSPSRNSTIPLAESISKSTLAWLVELKPMWVVFRHVRWGEDVTASCDYPAEDGTQSASPFTLFVQRSYQNGSEPVRRFMKAEDLIEALAAAIQHAISVPEVGK